MITEHDINDMDDEEFDDLLNSLIVVDGLPEYIDAEPCERFVINNLEPARGLVDFVTEWPEGAGMP